MGFSFSKVKTMGKGDDFYYKRKSLPYMEHIYSNITFAMVMTFEDKNRAFMSGKNR